MGDYIKLREFISQKIESGEISYRKLAKEIGLSKTYLLLIMSGQTGVPKNTEFYEKIARQFNIAPDDFVEYKYVKLIEYIRNASDEIITELYEEITKEKELCEKCGKELLPVYGMKDKQCMDCMNSKKK